MKKLILFFLLLTGISVLNAQCVEGDCVNGFGTYRYPGGNRYTGNWKEAKRYQGDFYYTNGDHYSGFFRDNEKHGPGVYRYSGGNRFEGMYNKGKKIEGTFYFSNGNRYVGQYRDDKRNGRGTMYLANGEELTGFWVDNKLNNQPNSSASSGQTYAVLVGISDYAEIGDLTYCDEDAYAFRNFLLSKAGGGVPSKNITLLLDNDATRANILEAMRKQFSKAKAEDRVVFFFSGHGDKGFFCPYDMSSTIELEHEEVKKAFKIAKAQNKICIADACFSGSIRGKGEKASSLKDLFMLDMEVADDEDGASKNGGTKVAVLMSSREDETSIEDQMTIKQGVFTYFMIEGLKGLADVDHDFKITYGELFEYVNSNVSEYSDGEQNPVLSCNSCKDTPLVSLKN